MIRVFKWKYAVGDRVESSQYGSIFTIYLNYSKDGEHYYDVVRDGKMFTFKKHMFENSTEKVLVEDEGGTTLKWKFKKGDVIHNGEETATIIGFDSVNNRYILSQNGLTFHRYKTIIEQSCEILEFDIEKFKQEYNDGLVCLSGNEKRVDEIANQLGLIWSDCYNQRRINRRDDSYRLILNSEWKCIANVKHIPFTSLIATKQVECRELPKIYPLKSEAELILDELENVVNKAKAVLERSGR